MNRYFKNLRENEIYRVVTFMRRRLVLIQRIHNFEWSQLCAGRRIRFLDDQVGDGDGWKFRHLLDTLPRDWYDKFMVVMTVEKEFVAVQDEMENALKFCVKWVLPFKKSWVERVVFCVGQLFVCRAHRKITPFLNFTTDLSTVGPTRVKRLRLIFKHII